MPLKDAAFDYGAPTFRSDNPRLGWCPFDGNLICLPLVSVLEPETDTGLSLVLSPEDTSRELTLRTTSSGRLTFTRTCHRIDARRPVKFAMDLVAHEADWRGSLRWMTARYPQFFEPANPLAQLSPDELARLSTQLQTRFWELDLNQPVQAAVFNAALRRSARKGLHG